MMVDWKKNPWPADKIERRKVEDLIPYARNPRRHSDRQVAQVAASIREWGWTIPILIDPDNTIIAGHCRLMAAQKLGIEEVPCMIAEGWTEAQRRAYVIADNQLTMNAEWDDELLALEIDGLAKMDFDLDLLGFSEVPTIFDEEEGVDEGSFYTGKVDAPVYTPVGEKPPVSALCDSSKAERLESEIVQAELPDDVRRFLLAAAQRHTVFNYQEIANFYAHSDAPIQRLMEDSVLVVIDYKKAIQQGYVRMCQELDLESESQDGDRSLKTLNATESSVSDNGLKVLYEAAQAAGIDHGQIRDIVGSWSLDGPLYHRWYNSLKAGKPDYGVYDDILYLGEAWGCWSMYSRDTVQKIAKKTKKMPQGLIDKIGPIDNVVDLGCGIGLTTAELKRIFPKADVIGTNMPGSMQWRIAEYIAKQGGFVMMKDPPAGLSGKTLIFASEYFEHFLEPIKELKRCLECRPQVLICANTFNSPSVGHFPEYQVDGSMISGKAASRAFGDAMRGAGYKKVDTGFWNSRPTVWRLNSRG